MAGVKHGSDPAPEGRDTDAVTGAPQRILPVLLVLFVGSGCAALIYEIVWFQMLELVIGASGVSIGVLLGTFMGGMCLGSLLLPRRVAQHHHPLRVYALLEAGIGACGLLLLFVIPHVSGVYSAIVGRGLAGILLRGAVCALLLLPPTVLMGATLPAIARWVETTPRGVSWMGFFYGGNIAGGVLGCLIAGFYLLRVHDVATTTVVAAAINGGVALLAFALSHAVRYQPTATARAAAEPVAAPAPVLTPATRSVFLVIALSGLTALGAQVVWTRQLALLLGGTVYTFSIILAAFLTGLGVGSSAGAYVARWADRPRLVLGLCQLGVVLGVAWTAAVLGRSLPDWPINPALATDPWTIFEMDAARTFWAVLPATLLWGASFPLAIAAAAGPRQDPGRLVGGVYAANTLGAIVGALGFGVFVIPAIGTQHAQQLLIGLATASALLLLVPVALAWDEVSRPTLSRAPGPSLAAVGGVVLAVVTATMLARVVTPVPPKLVEYGRLANVAPPVKALYIGEGISASIAVTEAEGGARHFHVSGKVEASSSPYDLRLQRMLGHLAALLHESPRSVLVVGFGAGVTAGSFVVHPTVKRIVVCEIEPLIPRKVGPYFEKENYYILDNDMAEIVFDDARHFILTTDEKFDVITSDPIHPWVKGAAALYTREYFELAKRRLRPGGIMTVWVPMYESTDEVVKSQIATFFDAFPNGTVWSNAVEGRGYDLVLVGPAGPARVDVDRLIARLEREDHEFVAWSLRDIGFDSVIDLLATYAGSARDLAPWLEGAAINRDRDLRLMYLAGLGLNLQRSPRIHEDMLSHRGTSGTIFDGSETNLRAVAERLVGAGSPASSVGGAETRR